MSYINVGASDLAGNRIKSKKALKEALSQDPASVVFDGTSPMGPQQFCRPATVASLPEGYTLSVSGPDPYAKRTWDASVKVINGKIKVS
jgi:hypothetical protein